MLQIRTDSRVPGVLPAFPHDEEFLNDKMPTILQINSLDFGVQFNMLLNLLGKLGIGFICLLIDQMR
jgi:hypothetical protein